MAQAGTGRETLGRVAAGSEDVWQENVVEPQQIMPLPGDTEMLERVVIEARQEAMVS